MDVVLQALDAIFDTGSTTLWVPSNEATCSTANYVPCKFEGGMFTDAKSSSVSCTVEFCRYDTYSQSEIHYVRVLSRVALLPDAICYWVIYWNAMLVWY